MSGSWYSYSELQGAIGYEPFTETLKRFFAASIKSAFE